MEVRKIEIKILKNLDTEMKEYLGIQEKYAQDDIVLARIDGEVRGKEICLFVPIKQEVKDLPPDDLKKMMKVVLQEICE